MKTLLYCISVIALFYCSCSNSGTKSSDTDQLHHGRNLIEIDTIIKLDIDNKKKNIYKLEVQDNKLNKDIYSKYTQATIAHLIDVNWYVYKYNGVDFQDYIGKSDDIEDSIIYRLDNGGMSCKIIYRNDTFYSNNAVNCITRESYPVCLSLTPDIYIINSGNSKYLICKSSVMGATGIASNTKFFIIYNYKNREYMLVDSECSDYPCYSICDFNNDKFLDFIRCTVNRHAVDEKVDLDIDIYSLNPQKIELIKSDKILNLDGY